jgi:hypothetical protein
VLAQFLVQRGQRLVQQQQLGLFDQGAGQRHALLFTARQRVGFAAGQPAHFHLVQHGRHPLAYLRRWQALLLQAIGHVLLHRHVREQRIGLEHHVHRPLVGRHRGHVHAVDYDRARAGGFETGQQAQQSGLARARAAEDREQLAPVDVEIDPVHRRNRPETPGHAAQAHQRLGLLPRSSRMTVHLHRPVLTRDQARVRRRSSLGS